MNVRRLGVIGAAGLLALAAAVPAAAQAPEDPLGVVEIPAGEPIHIAMWGVLSGANSVLGIDIVRGIEIAIDDRGGELLGREIQLTTEDALCSPEGGATAAQKLATDTTIVGLIGSVCSDETVGGIKALTDAGLTTIGSSTTRPLLTAPDRGPEYAGFARTAFNDAVQGKTVAEFVFNGLGLTKAATIHDGSAYAEALQQVFTDEFIKLGGQVVAQEAVSAGQSDMRPVLNKIAAAGPEVLYYPIFTAEGAFITAQSKEVAGLEDAVLIGSDGLFSSDMVMAAGPAAEGMYISAPDYSAMASGYADFVTKHQEKYGEAPLSAFHAHAYDGAGILFAAIEKVAVEGEDGTLYVPRGALREAIFATKDYPGITGTLSCTPTGDCGAPIIAVNQISAAEVAGGWPPTTKVWPITEPAG